MKCPCGGSTSITENVCLRCGAVYFEGKGWRAMPRNKEPDPKNYIECEKCSEAEGEPVFYHKSALVSKKQFFLNEGSGVPTCPKGHTVKLEPEVPA